MSSSRVPYDDIAGWYDALTRSMPLYRELVLPAMMELVGDRANLSILDLGCGSGLVARELARGGARVVGVDISARMLEIARKREREEPLGVRYIREDAQSLDALSDNAFNGVTCGMALMNIEDLDACAQAVKRVLKPGGWFVASITHPCFQTPESDWVETPQGPARQVRGYFDERFWESDNPDGVRGKVGEHHRTLSTYINTFARAGLLCEQLLEPAADGQRARDVPGNLEVPSILVAKWLAR
jgi:ubiquinone/menaquinone biosynthesis C-methylase UbiE